MSLSSNSIIHFTNDEISLKGILSDGFKVSLCKESIILGDTPLETHVPMVSFCDIPLSKIKDHIGKYGEYGIGLTKEWAERNGLNPVLYVEKSSSLSKSLLGSISRSIGTGSWTSEQKENVDVLRYLKNYQADLKRKTEEIKDYRFSDEREWRFVPHYESGCDFLLGSRGSISDDRWNEANEALKSLTLNFEPNDIKYIIIKTDDQISEFINLLRSNKGKHFSLYEIERLTTRILTAEQIMTDV